MFEIRRSGNLIEVVNGSQIESLFKQQLGYVYKKIYAGPILRQRKRWLDAQMRDKSLGMPYDVRADTFKPHIDFHPQSLYEINGDNLACPAGLKYRIIQILDHHGLPWKFNDLRSRQLPPADYARLLELGPITFKHRQEEILAMIDGTGGDNITIEAPTGLGKSFLCRLICAIYPTSRIVFISPGLDTIRGLKESLKSVIFDFGIVGDGHCDPEPRVTLASADSLHKVYMEKADLILGDECHLLVTPEKLQMLSRFTEAKIVGFSASPTGRSDGTDAVTEAVFGPVSLRISYQEAVANKAVTQIRVLMIEVPKQDTYSNNHEGEAWKRHAYWRNSFRNQMVGAAIKQVLPSYIAEPDPQVLVMVETIDHAYHLRQHMPDYQLVYAEPSDKTAWAKRQTVFENQKLWKPGEQVLLDKHRDQMRVQFEKGELKHVISTYCWSTGVDFCSLPVLIRADGQPSAAKDIQIPGRLSRLADGKEFGLLVDFMDRFDDKALRRSQQRVQAYRTRGWEIIHITPQVFYGSKIGTTDAAAV